MCQSIQNSVTSFTNDLSSKTWTIAFNLIYFLRRSRSHTCLNCIILLHYYAVFVTLLIHFSSLLNSIRFFCKPIGFSSLLFHFSSFLKVTFEQMLLICHIGIRARVKSGFVIWHFHIKRWIIFHISSEISREPFNFSIFSSSKHTFSILLSKIDKQVLIN